MGVFCKSGERNTNIMNKGLKECITWKNFIRKYCNDEPRVFCRQL